MEPTSLQLRLSPRPPRAEVARTKHFIGAGGAISCEWVNTVDEAGRPVSYLEETHFIRFPMVKAGTSGPPLLGSPL
jgi:hypothetical protein